MPFEIYTLPQHSSLKSLYTYWDKKRGKNICPSRGDIDPIDIPSLLPHIFMIDVHYPLEFKFRLVGTNIVEMLGMDLTKKNVSDIDLGDYKEDALLHLKQIVETQSSMVVNNTMDWNNKSKISYECLMLPLMSNNSVNIILGGVNFASDVCIDDTHTSQSKTIQII